MIDFNSNTVWAESIQDAWREVMWLTVKNGKDFLVKGGSYVGQIRKQLPDVKIIINHPSYRPLAPIMPPGIVGSTDEDKIVNYFGRYIMSDVKDPNEEYTYGEFIVKQVDRIIQLLKDSKGNTNQACIAIGDVSTTFLPDPPCLRLVSFKVVDGTLQMTVFFRSWDLYAGLPENLGGLQLLKEYVLEHVKEAIPALLDGRIVAYSDGLHIYSQYFEIVNALNVDKIKVNEDVLNEKKEYDTANI